MRSPHELHRPRSAIHDSTGTFSYHDSSCPHDMHADAGVTIDRRSGTRAATTLRNEPSASPGANAMAATVMRQPAGLFAVGAYGDASSGSPFWPYCLFFSSVTVTSGEP